MTVDDCSVNCTLLADCGIIDMAKGQPKCASACREDGAAFNKCMTDNSGSEEEGMCGSMQACKKLTPGR